LGGRFARREPRRPPDPWPHRRVATVRIATGALVVSTAARTEHRRPSRSLCRLARAWLAWYGPLWIGGANRSRRPSFRGSEGHSSRDAHACPQVRVPELVGGSRWR